MEEFFKGAPGPRGRPGNAGKKGPKGKISAEVNKLLGLFGCHEDSMFMFHVVHDIVGTLIIFRAE